MSQYIVPALFIAVLLGAVVKKKDAYSYYVEGTRSALSLMAGVFPYLLAIMMAFEVFRVSGVSAHVASFVAPVFKLMGLPAELTELLILRPLSGAGSLAVLDNIYKLYGADTYIGRCASVIYGSSETVFYVSTIYLSQSKCKKLRYAIPVSLISMLLGCIAGCLVLRML